MDSEKHFDEIAREYDFWKKKNWYYYANLIELYRSFIPKDSNVLEIGTGTGDILNALNPMIGKDMDISGEMIEIAKKKYLSKSNLSFERHDIYGSHEMFREDYIFLADVLEHVEDLPKFIGALFNRSKPRAKIIISVANPLWEPVLMLSEKMGMKMPEGPHNRLSIENNERIFKEAGFVLEQRGFRLLIPKKISGSNFVNRVFYKCKLLSRLGFVVFWVLEKK